MNSFAFEITKPGLPEAFNGIPTSELLKTSVVICPSA